jgi:hypothetical protein
MTLRTLVALRKIGKEDAQFYPREEDLPGSPVCPMLFLNDHLDYRNPESA